MPALKHTKAVRRQSGRALVPKVEEHEVTRMDRSKSDAWVRSHTNAWTVRLRIRLPARASARASVRPSVCPPTPYPAGTLEIQKSGNPKIRNTKNPKNDNSQEEEEEESRPKYWQVLDWQETNSCHFVGLLLTNLSMGQTNTYKYKNCIVFACFPWWAIGNPCCYAPLVAK